eukprot:GHVU01022823.1.p1 GENE.GHVU01022823.1~~GHVU01022823.1.p1  ORF type:complete len:232 (-),score=18.53 GHVU01022823.1:89-706(-)
MAVDGFATWWSLVIYKGLNMVSSVRVIERAKNQDQKSASPNPVADRFYFSKAFMRCTGKERYGMITRTFFLGSSSAFDMVWMAVSYALKHHAATLEAKDRVPSDVRIGEDGQRQGGYCATGDYDAYMVPTCINGFRFCMNPMFMKCSNKAVLPMKTILLNNAVVGGKQSKCALAIAESQVSGVQPPQPGKAPTKQQSGMHKSHAR